MNIALVVAGGIGQRVGRDIPKQFIEIENKPVIIYTLERVQACDAVDEIVLVCADGWMDFMWQKIAEYGITKLQRMVPGGDTRHASIFNGIECVHTFAQGSDIICVLDACRCLVPGEVIRQNIAAAALHGAAVTANPCFDSMYQQSSDRVVECMLDRSRILSAQTPESSTLNQLRAVYLRANADQISDMPPTALLLHYGYPVAASPSNPRNFKLTTEDDLDLLRAFLLLDRH